MKQVATRESIEACIDGLIRKYLDIAKADRGKMSEQDVRDYFVTPLLEVLGWGTIAPRERSAEAYLPRKGYSDYELCLPLGADPDDPYVPVIYVEAKKFGELVPLQHDLFGNEKRSEADYQVIGYADEYNRKRGEKIGWAILTNFELFRLWDTRRNVLVESTDWFNELKRDRTLEILFLLSRNEVFRDPALVSLSSYRKLPEIDEKFLSKLNEWRDGLANAIWKQERNRRSLGKTIPDQQANLRDVVQRTLDRLIVIRTAEDRGLLPPQYRLEEMTKSFGGENSVPLALLENIQRNTFRYFDARYNSKLFGAHLADAMEVHNAPLRLIIEEMCKASFASMNADILGATYEQYLGQTIEIDSKANRPKLVANLETRHAHGSYYTPRYIVQYIVDRTLGRYLYATESGRPQARSIKGLKRKTIEDIQDLSILDPACGSGSFLIYAFDVLLEFYKAEAERLQALLNSKIDVLVNRGIPRLIAEASHDAEFLALRANLSLTRFAHARIIERHLYGVDLDLQAAEVASMNLLLKALTRNERLPRILGDNVKVGNSLLSGARLGDDLSRYANDIQTLIEIRKKIHQVTLLASENLEDREIHEREIERLENESRSIAQPINMALNQTLKRKGDQGWFDGPEEKRPFLWQTEFPEIFCRSDSEVKGFTLVIGNPPYVGFHGFSDEKPFLRDTYSTCSGKFDIYVPFLERGLALTRETGKLSFICPSTFMKRAFGARLRKLLFNSAQIDLIHDFLHLKVFREALNYTCILVLSRNTALPEHTISYSEGGLENASRPYPQNKLSGSPWIFRFGAEELLVSKVKSDGRCMPLGNPNVARGVSEGIVTGKNSVLLVHQEDVTEFELESAYLKKCLRGEDVKRYSVNWGKYYVIYPYSLLNGDTQVVSEAILHGNCPNLYAYLLDRRGQLESRKYFEGTSKSWYEIWCPRDIRDQESDKIIVPELADRSQFASVGKEFFYVDTTCGIAPSSNAVADPWYVLSVLNSAAGEYLYRKTTVPKANGFLIYKTMFLKTFPIPIPQTPEELADAAEAGGLAQKIQGRNDRISQIEVVFEECLKATLPVIDNRSQSFGNDYYGDPSYWRYRRLIPENALQLSDPVVSMRVRAGGGRGIGASRSPLEMVIDYRSERAGAWKPLVELEPINRDLQLFLTLAIRRFAEENERKRAWRLPGGKSSKRTVDVVLGSLVVPTWRLPHGGGPQAETNIRMISELMKTVRAKLSGDPDVSLLETQAEGLDRKIDEIVFRLYRLSEEEQKQIFQSIHARY